MINLNCCYAWKILNCGLWISQDFYWIQQNYEIKQDVYVWWRLIVILLEQFIEGQGSCPLPHPRHSVFHNSEFSAVKSEDGHMFISHDSEWIGSNSYKQILP